MPAGRLYISYGVTRSGSTLAYKLLSRLLRLAGRPQRPLSPPLVLEGQDSNYTDELAPALLAATAPGELLAVKTHGPLTAAAAAWLREGQAIGHVVVRDPCDVALSLLGAGELAKTAGGGFGGIESLEIALTHLRKQDRYVADWLAQPNMLLLRYDELAGDPLGTAARLARQIGLDADRALLRRVAAVAQRPANPSTAALGARLSDAERTRIRDELPTLTRLAAASARRSLFGRLRRR